MSALADRPEEEPEGMTDRFLVNLRRMGVTRFPKKGLPRGDVLDPAWAAVCHSIADFLDACRAYDAGGYAEGYANLQTLLRGIPAPTTDGERWARGVLRDASRYGLAEEVTYPASGSYEPKEAA